MQRVYGHSSRGAPRSPPIRPGQLTSERIVTETVQNLPLEGFYFLLKVPVVLLEEDEGHSGSKFLLVPEVSGSLILYFFKWWPKLFGQYTDINKREVIKTDHFTYFKLKNILITYVITFEP